MNKIIAAALMMNCAVVGIATAEPYFKGPLEFGGTGCPAGTIAVVGEGTSTLTIMFDSHDAGNGMASKSGMPRTACSFAVPIHVPAGMQVSQVTADWMGYSKGSTKLKRTYFFSNAVSTPTNKVSNFPPPNGTDFTVRDNVNPYYTCGPAKDINFRIKSTVEANGNSSYIAVNNIVEFRVAFAPCP